MKSLRAGKLKAGFLFILLFEGLFSVKGQYKVSGEIIDVDYIFDDVRVALSTGDFRKDIALTKAGKFDVYLEWSKVYQFTFKKSGYVTKVIEFSTHLPDNVFPEAIQPYYLPVRLFKIFEGVDTVFFNQPIAKIKYDGEIADFTDDRDYSLKVRYRIDEMRRNKDHKNEVSSKSKFISKKKKEQISGNESVIDNLVKPDVNKTNDLINGLPPYYREERCVC